MHNLHPKQQTISVIVPTYNEVANIGPLLDQLTKVLHLHDYQIIVVDDSSPDGTSRIVQQRATLYPRVLLLQRPGKLGLAAAVLDGFNASNGHLVVMMDADLSHRPEDLPTLLLAASQAEIVIGSRYAKGGAIRDWPLHRRFSSRIAGALARAILRLTVTDPTSGFAVFHRHILSRLASGPPPPGFKLTLAALALNPGATVAEVPITFVNRCRGRSKFTPAEVLRFLRLCWQLRATRHLSASP